MSAMTIGLSHYLVLAALLFVTAVVGIFLNRKNIIRLLMCIEVDAAGCQCNFVAFSSYLQDLHGSFCFLYFDRGSC